MVQPALKPPPSPDDPSDLGDADSRYRRLIHQAHGADARIRLVQKAPSFGAPFFVADLDNGPQHVRLLGAFGPAPTTPSCDDPAIVTMSVMDLIHPARLMLDYARLMSLAFALCGKPGKALLLGGGGADLWRFVRTRLPDCLATLVEFDEAIAATARRWFYLDQPAVIDSGERFVARTTERFDVILVDLYNANGSAALQTAFWTHCLDALTPSGCLAANWPHADARTMAMAGALAEVAYSRGHSCFFAAPQDGGNTIQYLPTATGGGPEIAGEAFERFAVEQRLFDDGRGFPDSHVISPTFLGAT
jgi:hypothetical protein